MKIPPDILEEMYQHGRDVHPDECCGVVFAKKSAPDQLTRARRCANVQNKYHELDADRFPRTARTAYLIDARELLEIDAISRASDERLRVIYHSHCDTTAYFSDEDIAQATFEGEPVYPGVAYLVMSVIDREVRGHKIFVWDDAARSFRELAG